MRRLLPIEALVLATATATAQPPLPREWIRPTASSEADPVRTPIVQVIDGSGISDNGHDNDSQGWTMWVSSEGGGGSAANNPAGVEGPAWVLFEFSQTFDLSSARIWNHNQQDLTDRGLRRISVHAGDGSSGWSLLGNFELTRAPGVAGYATPDVIPLGDTHADRVLVTALPDDGNYGADRYGLSEVVFHGEPVVVLPEEWHMAVESVAIDSLYTETFAPQLVGYLGSDAAHSIPLSAERRLWLFGDTFLGSVRDGRRASVTAFIHNCIAIEDTTVHPPEIRYHWRDGPDAFFPHVAGTPGQFFWPTNGVVLDGMLFLFCYSANAGGTLGFTLDRTILIRVYNPQDDPAEWLWDARDFGLGSHEFGLHSAVYANPPYLYMLGFEEDPFTGHAVLARTRIADLLAGGLSETLEYWGMAVKGPGWVPTAEDLVPLFQPPNSETQIQYVPGWNRFLVTTYDPFTPGIYLTTAPALTGPWDPPVRIYNVPEHLTTSFDVMSYAARLHPDLSVNPYELVISYATNALNGIGFLFTREGLGIYHPRFVRIQLTPTAGSGEDTLSTY